MFLGDSLFRPASGRDEPLPFDRFFFDGSTVDKTGLKIEKKIKKSERTAMMDRIMPLHYEMEREIFPDIQVTFYPAGHIAGAACIYMKTPEGTVFYSGDYASFAQKTIEGLRIRRLRPDLCITESTYGDRLHSNRQVEENRLIRLTKETLEKGGKVLIPSFALGRAQEVILLLRQERKRRA